MYLFRNFTMNSNKESVAALQEVFGIGRFKSKLILSKIVYLILVF